MSDIVCNSHDSYCWQNNFQPGTHKKLDHEMFCQQQRIDSHWAVQGRKGIPHKFLLFVILHEQLHATLVT